jgi:hypothetical protein
MSLINDALKRASQSEKRRARDPIPPAPMQPAGESRHSSLPLAIGAAVVVLLTVAGWLVFRSFASRGNAAPPPSPIAAKPAAPAPPLEVEPTPAPVPAAAVVTAPPANTNPPAAPAAPMVAPPPPPPPFPDLKLQGIFYSRANPKIIINGQTRGENDQIGDVRIVKIAPTKVTVEWNGQTKELRSEAQ